MSRAVHYLQVGREGSARAERWIRASLERRFAARPIARVPIWAWGLLLVAGVVLGRTGTVAARRAPRPKTGPSPVVTVRELPPRQLAFRPPASAPLAATPGASLPAPHAQLSPPAPATPAPAAPVPVAPAPAAPAAKPPPAAPAAHARPAPGQPPAAKHLQPPLFDLRRLPGLLILRLYRPGWPAVHGRTYHWRHYHYHYHYRHHRHR